jgi:hypothetical protein
VVTEIVEGEAVEVVVTAGPEGFAAYPSSGGVVAISDEPGSADQLIVAPAANRMVIKDAEMELLVRTQYRSGAGRCYPNGLRFWRIPHQFSNVV